MRRPFRGSRSAPPRPCRSRSGASCRSSSALGPASSVACTGSSAMPQIGTVAGLRPPDLRMHRAGIDDAPSARGGSVVREFQIFVRIGNELGLAIRAAKIMDYAIMFGAVFCGRRIDRHSADGIARVAGGRGTRRGDLVVVMMRSILYRGHERALGICNFDIIISPRANPSLALQATRQPSWPIHLAGQLIWIKVRPRCGDDSVQSRQASRRIRPCPPASKFLYTPLLLPLLSL